MHRRSSVVRISNSSSDRHVSLNGAAVVEELEEVAFVWLFPLNAVGWECAEVEAFDIGAEEELLDKMWVFGEGRDDEGLADVREHFGLRNFYDAGVGKHELGVGEGMIFFGTGNECGLEIGLIKGVDFAWSVAMKGRDIGDAGIFEVGGDEIVDAVG